MRWLLKLKNGTEYSIGTKQQFDAICKTLGGNPPAFLKVMGQMIATNMIAECNEIEDKPRFSRPPVYKPSQEAIDTYNKYAEIDTTPEAYATWGDVLIEIPSLDNFMPELLCITDSLVCLAIHHEFAGFVRDHHTEPIKETLKELTGRDYTVKIIVNTGG